MRIPWKFKSFIFHLIDIFDMKSFLYFFQKNISRRSKKYINVISNDWIFHKRVLEKYKKTEFIFEFGAGKNLAQNIFLSQSILKQLVIDLNPMIDLDLVNKSNKYLSGKIRLRNINQIKKIQDLQYLGIYYRAPYDAKNTDLPNECLDACISTNTLEHIEVNDIEKIFKEIHRILKKEGIVSIKIDYSDHYAHTDSNISLLNFLKYNNFEWKNYNHSCHFQNRLRHFEYIEIFNNLGFKKIEEIIYCDEKNIPKNIEAIYENIDKTWRATSSYIVLKKV